MGIKLELFPGAHLLPCRQYRYFLERRWERGDRILNVIGLNPSTADESIDDPTIRRCICYAKDNGFSSLQMTNLFAFRATKPADLFKAPDPVGTHNDRWLQFVARTSTVILFAWGNHGRHMGRDQHVLDMLPSGYCLGSNKNGTPKHPLYINKTQPFIQYAT